MPVDRRPAGEDRVAQACAELRLREPLDVRTQVEELERVGGTEVGVLLLDAVLASDYNVILCVTLFSAIATQLGYLTSDVLCARLDPRIRLGAAIEGARR